MQVAELRPSSASQPRPLVTRKDLIWLVYYYPLRGLTMVLPQGLFPWVGRAVDRFVQILRRREKRAAVKRVLELLEVSSDQAQQIARQYVSNAARSALFHLWLYSGRRPPGADLVKIVGQEHLDRALADKRGAVLVSMHTWAKRQGNMALREKGCSIMFVHRAGMSGPHGRLGQRLAGPHYRRIQVIVNPDGINPESPDAIMRIAQRLRSNGLVALTADYGGWGASMRVPFLKLDKRINTGPLELARLTQCALVPVWFGYDGPACRIEFRPALELKRNAPRETWVQENMPVLAVALAEQLTADPSQWEFLARM